MLLVTTLFLFSSILGLTAASLPDGTPSPLHTSGVSLLLEHSVILILARIDCLDRWMLADVLLEKRLRYICKTALHEVTVIRGCVWGGVTWGVGGNARKNA